MLTTQPLFQPWLCTLCKIVYNCGEYLGLSRLVKEAPCVIIEPGLQRHKHHIMRDPLVEKGNMVQTAL